MDTTASYYWLDEDYVDRDDERVVGSVMEHPPSRFNAYDEKGKGLGRFLTLERAKREVETLLAGANHRDA
jgi:hypothetical protein